MVDERTVSGAQSRERIDLSREQELRSWAIKLGVTPKALKSAVATVGARVEKVRDYLKVK